VIVVGGDLQARAPRIAAVAVAARASSDGAEVQVVGVVQDDPAGDQLLRELAGGGVGHAAVLREPVRDLEEADLDLALRYLPGIRVVVVVALPPAVVAVAGEHAAWAGASLVVIEGADRATDPAATTSTAEVPDGATVLQAPRSDPDGTFAGFVGAFAARLDGGATPADAWAATTRELAVDRV